MTPRSTPRSRRSTASSTRCAAGTDDYMPMEGTFARYLEDHYSAAPVEREALTDECEIVGRRRRLRRTAAVVQAVSQAGFTDIRFCEKGGDVGGTWYWNRYPGIACDVESYSLPPPARGDGVLPDDEVRVGLRDLRVLPADGGEVRLLRPLPVPHRGEPGRLGRRGRALDACRPTGATPCGPGS